MPTVRETIESRWSPDWDKQRFAGAWIQMNRAFRIESEIRDLVEKVARNSHLSAIGKQDKIRQALSNGLGGDLHKLRKAIETASNSISAWKSRAQSVTFDKADAAGAMIRAEMRTMLRTMRSGERHAALLRGDADEQLMIAALEAPNLLSGINDQVRGQVLESVARRRKPNDVAAIEQAEEAIALARTAARIALNTASKAGEFPSDHVFNQCGLYAGLLSRTCRRESPDPRPEYLGHSKDGIEPSCADLTTDGTKQSRRRFHAR